MTAVDHMPSRACYQHGCDRPACAQENYRYQKQLKVEHNRGQRRLRDATQTRAHIHRLVAAGWTQSQIAAASGVLSASVHKLATGSQRQVANWRAAAILSIHIGPPPPDRTHVDATGSRRRLRALRVLGHSRTRLADEIGSTPDRIKAITNGLVARVRADEEGRIRRLYRRLATVPGQRQVASVARARGWHGPLAWDDIDNPDARPETTTGRQRPGLARPDVDPRRVLRLTTEGLSAAQIADRLGCHKRTVVRARGRATTNDLKEAA